MRTIFENCSQMFYRENACLRTDQEQEWMSINIEGEDVREAYLKWLRARVEMGRG